MQTPLLCFATNKLISVSFSKILFALFDISSLQEEAGSLLVDLSSSLNTISVSQAGQDDGDVVQAATPILEAASNILNVSSNVRAKNDCCQC